MLHLCALPLAVLGVSPLIWLGLHATKSIYGRGLDHHQRAISTRRPRCASLTE